MPKACDSINGTRTFLKALTFLFLSGLVLSGIAIGDIHASATAQRCDPIGRIVSGHGENFSEGQIVCRGDRLQLQPGIPVDFLCFLNREVITFDQARVLTIDSNICAPPSGSRRCGQGNDQGLCFNPRGESAAETFQITQPLTNSIADPQPTIAWTPVPQADRYSVRMLGTQVSWEATTATTHLNYPTGEATLQPGHAYRIVIIAHQNGDTLATTERIVNVTGATAGEQSRELSVEP